MRAGGDQLQRGRNILGQIGCPGSRADLCQSKTTNSMDYTSNVPAVAN